MSTAVAVTPELAKTKAAALKESTPIISQAQQLMVVDEESYQRADEIRTTLKATIKKWSDRLELIIRPARQALDGLYALNREITDPLKQADVIITRSMADYKRREAQRIEEENAKRVLEENRLRREQEEAQRKAEAAKSKPLQRMLEKKAEKIAEELEGVKGVDTPAPVQAQGSTTRTVKDWRVVDMMKLVKAVAAGSVPLDVLEVNTVVMRDYFRGDDEKKSSIRTWPGIEVFTDYIITSRRGK